MLVDVPRILSVCMLAGSEDILQLLLQSSQPYNGMKELRLEHFIEVCLCKLGAVEGDLFKFKFVSKDAKLFLHLNKVITRSIELERDVQVVKVLMQSRNIRV